MEGEMAIVQDLVGFLAVTAFIVAAQIWILV